ncbi:MAG: copper-binding protein [Tolumonas sp.]|nr:copper-binding protein [Tolumonas sp.]
MASHYLAKIIIATLFTTTICNASIHTYHVNGTVKQVNLTNNTVVLIQDSVIELGWPKRIMSYHVNSANILKNINSGENVSAVFTAESAYNPVIHSITH